MFLILCGSGWLSGKVSESWNTLVYFKILVYLYLSMQIFSNDFIYKFSKNLVRGNKEKVYGYLRKQSIKFI